jgi:hypothetical protein
MYPALQLHFDGPLLHAGVTWPVLEVERLLYGVQVLCLSTVCSW